MGVLIPPHVMGRILGFLDPLDGPETRAVLAKSLRLSSQIHEMGGVRLYSVIQLNRVQEASWLSISHGSERLRRILEERPSYPRKPLVSSRQFHLCQHLIVGPHNHSHQNIAVSSIFDNVRILEVALDGPFPPMHHPGYPGHWPYLCNDTSLDKELDCPFLRDLKPATVLFDVCHLFRTASWIYGLVDSDPHPIPFLNSATRIIFRPHRLHPEHPMSFSPAESLPGAILSRVNSEKLCVILFDSFEEDDPMDSQAPEIVSNRRDLWLHCVGDLLLRLECDVQVVGIEHAGLSWRTPPADGSKTPVTAGVREYITGRAESGSTAVQTSEWVTGLLDRLSFVSLEEYAKDIQSDEKSILTTSSLR